MNWLWKFPITNQSRRLLFIEIAIWSSIEVALVDSLLYKAMFPVDNPSIRQSTSLEPQQNLQIFHHESSARLCCIGSCSRFVSKWVLFMKLWTNFSISLCIQWTSLPVSSQEWFLPSFDKRTQVLWMRLGNCLRVRVPCQPVLQWEAVSMRLQSGHRGLERGVLHSTNGHTSSRRPRTPHRRTRGWSDRRGNFDPKQSFVIAVIDWLTLVLFE